MSAVDEDPQLTRMIVESISDAIQKNASAFEAAKDEHTAIALGQLVDAATMLFTGYPELESLVWTFTSGEYNDQSYNGFRVGDTGVQFNRDVTPFVSTEYDPEANTLVVEKGITELVGWKDWKPHYLAFDLVTSAIARLMDTFSDYFENTYGAGLTLILDRNGMHTELS